MFQHILVPTDGSELSTRAARSAVDFARSSKARLTALHTTPMFYPTELGAHAVYMRVQEHNELSEQSAQKALGAIEQIAREGGVGIDTVHRVTDHPWEAIVSVAQERQCDLIFMASHGRRGVNALLMGSETNKVLIHTKIPVLVWR